MYNRLGYKGNLHLRELRWLVVLLFLVQSHVFLGQKRSSLVIQNYTPKQYNAHTQNWAILQDQRGIVYVGNNNGIIEYDGKNWKLIETDGIVRSMDSDKDGTIYVGTQANFGKLVVDSTGELMYASIYSQFKDSLWLEDSLDFGDLWNTYCIDSCVYFLSNEVLLEWNPSSEKLNYWKASAENGRFHVALEMNGRLFIKNIKGGLFELKNGKLDPINKGEQFNKYHVFSILPYKEDTLLIGTYRNGILKYAESTGEIIAFNTEIDDFIVDNGIYNGRLLTNGNYLFGTLNGGAVIIDASGELIQFITPDQGLQSSKVKSTMISQNGDLWMALNYGFSKVEINSPWSKWGEEHGLDTKIYCSEVMGDELFVGTPIGAFHKKLNESKFKPIESIKGQTWDWYRYRKYPNSGSKEEGLLVANQNYLGEYKNGEVEIITPALQVYFIFESNRVEGQFYIGMNDGLGVLKYENDQWTYLGKNKFLDSEVRSCYEEKNGDLWLTTSYDGVYHMNMDSVLSAVSSPVSNYDTTSGLVSMRRTSIEELDNHLVFGQSGGVFQFDETSQKFIRDSYFSSVVPGSDSTHGFRNFMKDESGSLWFCRDDAAQSKIEYMELNMQNSSFNYLVDKNENQFLETKIYRRVPLDEVVEIKPIQSNQRSYMQFATSEGLFVYELGKQDWANQLPKIALRSIVEGKQNHLFKGNKEDVQIELDWFELSHEQNSLVFSFSSPSYVSEELTEYSYILEGFDKEGEWSDWTTETKKEYTNLDPMDHYRFKVKARNVFGLESEPVVCLFSIRKPWYTKWYAYLLYILIALFAIYLIIKGYTYRLRRKNLKLEQLVTDRTTEIQQKNLELEQYNEEIMAQRDQIESQKIMVEEANEELNQTNEEILAQRDQIESQKNKLLKQNKDIFASISYARKIQEAILPSEEVINETLPNSFFFYRPKDIVSGDFYWVERVGEKVYWAAVDCTGHGVPGAFMSILGSNSLTQIIIERGVEKPAQILEELTKHVIDSMGETRDGKDIMDGMDIALCCWNQETGILDYAGAYNPLFLIRNGELHETKATRRPVGRYLSKRTKPFENHSIELKSDDMIYVFSDGFADQFGGENGDKYTYKRLRAKLKECSNEEVLIQRTTLEKEFDEWKGNRGQLDDVCLIGVRIVSPTPLKVTNVINN